MEENRKDPRFDVSLTARLPDSVANHEVRISDLSVGGCYVDNIAQVLPGETIILAILKPDGEWLELRGEVVYHSPRLGFGVRFVELGEAQLGWIQSSTAQSALDREAEAPAALVLEESQVICYQLV
jgi:hypothetical protein